MMRYLTRDEEARRLMDTIGGEKFEPVLVQLQRQFDVLHARAQVLLTLCGIVITVTGFSGRIIAQAGQLAKACIVSGLSLVLVSGAIVVVFVLPLKWLTKHAGDTPRLWLDQMLATRDRKTSVYQTAIYILLAGLVLYVTALCLMLLSAEIAQMPAYER